MDSISFIKSPISAELEDFKKHFDSCLSSSNLLLNSVIAHIRQKNGKMMRPILVLLAAKLYNEICPATLHAAVALELLHTASLVHDDVVDESTERRGQLSVNAVFNNKVAVLTGDYLLATALVEVGMTRNYGIIDIVSKLGQDLAEGELLQLSNVSNPEYSEDIYFDVIRKKTAVLFAACMKAAHDQRNRAAADVIPAAAVIIGYATLTHIYDSKDCSTVLHKCMLLSRKYFLLRENYTTISLTPIFRAGTPVEQCAHTVSNEIFTPVGRNLHDCFVINFHSFLSFPAFLYCNHSQSVI